MVTSDSSGTKKERWLPDSLVTTVKGRKSSAPLANSAGIMSNLRRLRIHSQLQIPKQIFKMQGRGPSSVPNTSCVRSCVDHSESVEYVLLDPDFYRVSCM